jgi:hypothetical protein
MKILYAVQRTGNGHIARAREQQIRFEAYNHEEQIIDEIITKHAPVKPYPDYITQPALG